MADDSRPEEELPVTSSRPNQRRRWLRMGFWLGVCGLGCILFLYWRLNAMWSLATELLRQATQERRLLLDRCTSAEAQLKKLQAEQAKVAQADSPKTIWRPVLVDDFSRAELGPHWKATKGAWKLQDGKLKTTSSETDSFLILIDQDFSGDFQVSYRCRTLRCYNGKACDASWMAALPVKEPVDPVGGYLFRFGSYDNTWSGLSRSGGGKGLVINENPAGLIKPNQWQTVTLMREGDWLSLLVDEIVVFLVHDRDALHDATAKWGGFYIYRSEVEIDDLVVSRPVPVRDLTKGGLEVRNPPPPPPPAKPKPAAAGDENFGAEIF